MPSDAPQFHPKPKQKSLESLKETFKQRLDSILNKQLSVENIETFADEALDKTIKLAEDVSKEYETNGALNAGPASMREKEDFVFSVLELPNLQQVLQSIIDVKERIDRIRKDISEANITADKVFIPPQNDSPLTLNNGTGQGIEEKKLIPRLLTLLYILETDFEIQKEQVKITEGKVSPEMIRQTPYVRVEVADMGRLIYICDEEGNASYVFNTDKLKEAGIDTETLDISDKGAINDLIAKHPEIGIRIIQTINWRTNMSKVLKNQIPEKVEEKSERPLSEFIRREKRKKWTFETLQADVRDPKKDIKNSEDYCKNAPKYQWPNWKTLTKMPEFPKNPDSSNDWNTFLGREKRKEWTFETLQEDVRAKGIASSEDYKNRSSKNKWFSPDYLTSMSQFPKNSDGSNDWNTFLGREKKKEWIFETLQADVRTKDIESSKDYQNNAQKNKWPASVTLTSMPQFPKKQNGLNDWGKFLDENE